LFFDNLTNYEPSKVRNRALIGDPFGTFSINAHPIFEMSSPEDPIIGSIEDWHIINTMSWFAIPHPIHIHLINFQIMSVYNMIQLRQTKADVFLTNPFAGIPNCTLYAVDFFGINVNDPEVCMKTYPRDYTSYVNLYDETDPNSVIDVFTGCVKSKRGGFKNNTCKYV
jgi:hypothetical protein